MSLAFLLAFAAAAASNTDSLAIQAVHNYGACIAQQTPRGVRSVLSMDYRSPDYEKKLWSIIRGHDRCMPFDGRLGSESLLFAGAMAEAILKADVSGTELPRRLAYDPGRELIAARSPMEAMALCTVMKAPEVTSKVLATKPATRDEIEAMKPLGPVLGECLQKDVKLEVNKPALRSLLALAAWRIVTTPRKPS